VISAGTGAEGLHLAENQKPDLLLLDIILPGGMNGFDVLEQIKRNDSLKDIPVIVLTNLDSETVIAKKIGAADYMIKSETSLDEMIVKIKMILGSA
jgi:DNA-binding response OmpR family regulator